jgi:hypothetical protein
LLYLPFPVVLRLHLELKLLPFSPRIILIIFLIALRSINRLLLIIPHNILLTLLMYHLNIYFLQYTIFLS